MLTYHATHRPLDRIDTVRIKVLSDDEVRRLSVVEVTEPTIYSRGLPTPGGINDHRMGTVDRRILCGSCGGDVSTCQGHPGHIEFPFPMYHSAFFDTMLRLLRCLCFFCGRACVLEEDVPDEAGGGGGGVGSGSGSGCSKQRLAAIHALIKTRKRCPHCSAVRPSLVRVQMSIRIEWPADMAWESEEEEAYCTRPFSQRDARSMLQFVPPEDLALLGFDAAASRPVDMTCTALLVPPPCARPTIMASEGSKTRGQDDLTCKLQEILKRANDVRTAMRGAHWSEVELTPELLDRVQRMQYEVFTLVSNSVRGQKPSTYRAPAPIKSLIERIKGKDGRIRGNLMGKRVDFSARSVVSPAPCLDVDQLGVPERVAVAQTVPEVVTQHNLADLAARVRVGSGALGGAEAVISPDGVVVHLVAAEAGATAPTVPLAPGWVVERYLRDGDVVIFNRQPSLHKMGMMGHVVRIVRGQTFRVNLSVTSPYNADFDGDEMNLHVPQSLSARASVRTVMMVSQQMVSPQANKPCISLVQDALLGAYLMTRPAELLTQELASHVVGHLGGGGSGGASSAAPTRLPTPAVVLFGSGGRRRRRPYWTGKQLFSLLFPESLDWGRVGVRSADPSRLGDLLASACASSSRVLVRSGLLLSGRLTKATLGGSAGGIVDVLCRDHPRSVAATFLAQAQRLVYAYNDVRGFNVGIRDCVLDATSEARVRARLAEATRLADEIGVEVGGGGYSAEDEEEAEGTIRKILSRALMQAGGIVEESIAPSNAIRSMVNCGSKGSPINLSQIGACVGQQSVEGRRITAEKGNRTLPCFSFGDASLRARGFVQSSYSKGLDPTEFFFHTMGGREGLVDTAVKTASTGYIQRRIVKACESLVARYDGTVRNADDGVLQFAYAVHGFDPTRLERVEVPLAFATAEAVRSRLGRSDDADAFLEARRPLLEATLGVAAPVSLSDAEGVRYALPVDLGRLGRETLPAEHGERDEPRGEREEHPHGEGDAAYAAYASLLDSLVWPPLRLSLLLACPPSRARVLCRTAPAALLRFASVASGRIRAASVSAGEMVGCIAAQSIGEPTTQMTLNTFHWSGIAAKNVTLGIPRLQELLTVSRTLRSSGMVLRLRDGGAARATADHGLADLLAATLPLTLLDDVVQAVEVVDSIRESDVWMCEPLGGFGDGEGGDEGKAPPPPPLMVRLVLDQTSLRLRRLTPPDVRRALARRLEGRARVVSSEELDVEWVVRIHFVDLARMAAAGGLSVAKTTLILHRATQRLLSTVELGGHPDVRSASTREETRLVVLDPTTRGGEDGRRSSAATRADAAVVERTCPVVDTVGTCLLSVACLPSIDWYQSTSNDICEVRAVLGIEAAAAVLYEELLRVISFDGTYIFAGHLLLVVDTMTREGKLKALNRFGVNRDASNALTRCSFEETPDILSDAAAFGETTPSTGVSTSIMLGQPAAVGTGMVDVAFHPRCLPDAIASQTSSARRVVRTVVRASTERADEGVVECDLDLRSREEEEGGESGKRARSTLGRSSGSERGASFSAADSEGGGGGPRRVVSFAPAPPSTQVFRFGTPPPSP